MKCRFTQEMEINIDRARGDLKGAAVSRVVHGVTRWFVPAGTVYTSDKAWLWVQHGCAVPVDDACEIKADRTPEQMEVAQQHYQRNYIDKIDPSDFELYEKGIITGYEMDGSYKHGPNWDQHKQEKQDEDDDW